jgi:hypothetical protein
MHESRERERERAKGGWKVERSSPPSAFILHLPATKGSHMLLSNETHVPPFARAGVATHNAIKKVNMTLAQKGTFFIFFVVFFFFCAVVYLLVFFFVETGVVVLRRGGVCLFVCQGREIKINKNKINTIKANLYSHHFFFFWQNGQSYSPPPLLQLMHPTIFFFLFFR